MPVSQSILILIYLDKQLFNCKLLSRKLKIRRSPLLDVIPLHVFTCLSVQNNKVQSCVTRGPCRASWSGFYCAYWVHGTKALKYKNTMKLNWYCRHVTMHTPTLSVRIFVMFASSSWLEIFVAINKVWHFYF